MLMLCHQANKHFHITCCCCIYESIKDICCSCSIDPVTLVSAEVVTVSVDVVDTTDDTDCWGLPVAVEVLGSSLVGLPALAEVGGLSVNEHHLAILILDFTNGN